MCWPKSCRKYLSFLKFSLHCPLPLPSFHSFCIHTRRTWFRKLDIENWRAHFSPTFVICFTELLVNCIELCSRKFLPVVCNFKNFRSFHFSQMLWLLQKSSIYNFLLSLNFRLFFVYGFFTRVRYFDCVIRFIKFIISSSPSYLLLCSQRFPVDARALVQNGCSETIVQKIYFHILYLNSIGNQFPKSYIITRTTTAFHFHKNVGFTLPLNPANDAFWCYSLLCKSRYWNLDWWLIISNGS